MAFKAVVVCVFAVLGQTLAGSCYRKSSSPSFGSNRASISVNEDFAPVYSYEGIAVSEVPIDYQASYKPVAVSSSASVLASENGGAFTVTSFGPIAPSGIAVATDLGLSGDLELAGELPYLSAVGFEGQFATSGGTAVSYGCGDGCIAITEQIGNAPSAYGISSLNGCGCRKL